MPSAWQTMKRFEKRQALAYFKDHHIQAENRRNYMMQLSKHSTRPRTYRHGILLGADIIRCLHLIFSSPAHDSFFFLATQAEQFALQFVSSVIASSALFSSQCGVCSCANDIASQLVFFVTWTQLF